MRATLKAGIGNNPLINWPYENFEFYVSSSNLNGLNSGWLWGGSWIVRGYYYNIYSYDSMESYLTSSIPSGSSGGIGNWTGPYNTN